MITMITKIKQKSTVITSFSYIRPNLNTFLSNICIMGVFLVNFAKPFIPFKNDAF